MSSSSFNDFVALLRRNSKTGNAGVQHAVFRPPKRRARTPDTESNGADFGEEQSADKAGSSKQSKREVMDFASAKREVMRLGETGFTFESREIAEEKRAILLGAKPRKHENENFADFLRKREEEKVAARRTARLKSAVRDWERDEHVRVKRRRNDKEGTNSGPNRDRGSGRGREAPAARDERRKPLKRGKLKRSGGAGAGAGASRMRATMIRRKGGRAFDGVPGKYLDGVQRISRKDLDGMRQRSRPKR